MFSFTLPTPVLVCAALFATALVILGIGLFVVLARAVQCYEAKVAAGLPDDDQGDDAPEGMTFGPLIACDFPACEYRPASPAVDPLAARLQALGSFVAMVGSHVGQDTKNSASLVEDDARDEALEAAYHAIKDLSVKARAGAFPVNEMKRESDRFAEYFGLGSKAK